MLATLYISYKFLARPGSKVLLLTTTSNLRLYSLILRVVVTMPLPFDAWMHDTLRVSAIIHLYSIYHSVITTPPVNYKRVRNAV